MALSMATVVLAKIAAHVPSARSETTSPGACVPSRPETSTLGSPVAHRASDVQPEWKSPNLPRVADLLESNLAIAFAPQPACAALNLVEKIVGFAHDTIATAAYELSLEPIVEALLAGSRRGVHVSIVPDGQENRGALRPELAADVQGGILARTDDKYSAMHQMFIAADGRHVETGNYNYSHSAQRLNAENAIVPWNNPEIASKFSVRFFELWSESGASGDAL
jgi:phosphatidylserine/phosphatidylglycerophosphate/cardiolipin synthase-like enzyme